MTGPGPDEHRALRELLGAHTLSALPPRQEAALLAHLDGCPACRAELAGLAGLGDALRLADPDRLAGPPAQPPADLGARTLAAVARERALRDRRSRRAGLGRGLLSAAAAVVLLGAGAGLGVVLSRPAPAPPVPREPVALHAVAPGVGVTSAVLVPHTWGVEVDVVLTGLGQGAPYRAVVVDRAGRPRPAGEFLGVADRPVVCDLQAALLRADARAFLLLDASGSTVAEADLPA